MKLSERILDMRIKNVPDGEDWFGCALSEIMGIIDEVAQLEEEIATLKREKYGLIDWRKPVEGD